MKFSPVYSIITNEDDLNKENTRITQALKKDNGYQKSIISTVLKRITDNHNLVQSKQLTQVTHIQENRIRMIMN